jgi:hypothetical protein
MLISIGGLVIGFPHPADNSVHKLNSQAPSVQEQIARMLTQCQAAC